MTLWISLRGNRVALVGLTYDLIDESFYKPIIVAPTNPCSTSTSTSSSSDGFTYDASLMVENETLKKEVNELTHILAKAYDGEDRLLICLGSQRASLYKEGLDYTPRKARRSLLLTRLVLWRTMVGFTLVASKLVTKSMIARTWNHMLMYPQLSLILVIWVPKSLVTNLQGPKQVLVSKKNWSSLVGQLQSQRKALGSS